MIKCNKKKLIYILSVVLIVIQMCFTGAFSDGHDKKVRKDESVYVTLDNSGQPKDIIVSDWLRIMEGKGEIKDRTILRNITNINGYEAPEQNGASLVWKPEGRDIFYQGTTSKQLPLKVHIKYYLNEKELSPEKILGRSGRLRMLISIANNETHMIAIKGTQKKLYTPFTAAVVVNLPIDKFSNIKANGKIISDASNQIITFVTFPGLSECFNIKKELLRVDDTLEIKADVKGFELNSIMITATPELPDLRILDSLEEADKLVAGVNTLKDSSSQLAKGSEQLRDGQKELCFNIGKLRYGIIQLDDGAKELANGTVILGDGVKLAHDGAVEVHEGVVSLIENADNIGSGADIVGKEAKAFAEDSMSFAQDAVNIMERVAYLSKGSPAMEKELKRSISQLKDRSIGLKISAEKISIQSKLLNKFLDSFKKVTQSLATGSKRLVDGISQISKGLKELKEGAAALSKGTTELSTGAIELEDGSRQVLAGSNKLSENMNKFHKEGMEKFKLSFGEGIKDLEEALLIKDEMIKLSKNYVTFTGLGENMTGSVKFIMKTDEIRINRKNTLKYDGARKKDEGFFKWLIGKYLK